jgi:iron complex outermembrane recepter protein
MESIELEAVSGRALLLTRTLCASFVATACLCASGWANATDATTTTEATAATTTAATTTAATTTAATGTTAASGTADDSGLAEITVTAERYTSTIQNTAISISALSGDELIKQGVTTIQEITQEVPGLSMRFASPGLTEYEARGLASNGGAAPTVGFYLDEIPLSPPAVSQSGKVVINPDLYDVQRVEVLRGPQGTLYGSGSMGGTIRVLTNEPKLGTYEGSAQATGSDTEGGSGNGSANLMMNLPIGETIAARVVLSYLYRSGWIDNITIHPFPIALGNPAYTQPLNTVPVTNVYHDANNETLYSGRLSLLYKPSEDFSILGEAMTQNLHTGGYDLLDGTPTSAEPTTVYGAHYEAFPLREGIRDDISIFGLTIKANVGFADLTSATSYFGRTGVQVQDASTSIYWTNNGGTPYVPIPYAERDPSHQISEEIRLTSHDIGGFHWVAGAFYSNLSSVWNEVSNNPLAATPAVPDGSFFTSWNSYGVRQTAFFADGSYKFTDQWKLSAGARYYQYKSHQDEFSWGLDGPNPTPPPASVVTTAKNSGANPRVNLEYLPNQDLTLYATVAKGFRPGGANQILPPPNEPPHCALPGPLEFSPDSVWNYEVGEKARMFDSWLTINSDFYYIKWNNIQQVFTLTCGYQFYGNAGDARSFGPELEVNAKLSPDWTVSLSGAYTDAKINNPNANYTIYLTTQVTEPNGVSHPCQTGSSCTAPVMNVVKDTASVALNYATTVMTDWRVSGRAAYSFVGSSYDVAYYFGYKLPSYSLVNARVGLGRGNWDAALFVDNLTNKVALISANNTSFQFNSPQVVRYSTNQPRTAGIQLDYKF